MRPDDLLDAIGEVRDAWIEDAAGTMEAAGAKETADVTEAAGVSLADARAKRSRSVMKWSAVAACVCLCIISAAAFGRLSAPKEVATESAAVTEDSIDIELAEETPADAAPAAELPAEEEASAELPAEEVQAKEEAADTDASGETFAGTADSVTDADMFTAASARLSGSDETLDLDPAQIRNLLALISSAEPSASADPSPAGGGDSPKEEPQADSDPWVSFTLTRADGSVMEVHVSSDRLWVDDAEYLLDETLSNDLHTFTEQL